MKKILIITIVIAAVFTSCREPILIPFVGAVEGTVVNIHDEPLQGVEVQITHVPASESSEAEEKTISTITDFDGRFLLDDVWDEFRINVIKAGFRGASEHHIIVSGDTEQTLDFTLIGAPETAEIILEKTILTDSDTTDLTVLVTVEDEFNVEATGYSGTLMLTDQNGNLQAVSSLTPRAEGVGAATLEAKISSGSIATGVYTLSAAVTDPDGNQIVTNANQQLTVE